MAKKSAAEPEIHTLTWLQNVKLLTPTIATAKQPHTEKVSGYETLMLKVKISTTMLRYKHKLITYVPEIVSFFNITFLNCICEHVGFMHLKIRSK